MSGNQVDFSFLSPNELPHTRGSGVYSLSHPAHPQAVFLVRKRGEYPNGDQLSGRLRLRNAAQGWTRTRYSSTTSGVAGTVNPTLAPGGELVATSSHEVKSMVRCRT
jgi:hypothetical protein